MNRNFPKKNILQRESKELNKPRKKKEREREKRKERGRGSESRGARGGEEHMSFGVPRGATGFLYAWDSYIKREAPAETRRGG